VKCFATHGHNNGRHVYVTTACNPAWRPIDDIEYVSNPDRATCPKCVAKIIEADAKFNEISEVINQARERRRLA